jgi:hypothetical protein
MKSYVLGSMLIPAIVTLFVGIGCQYYSFQFRAQVVDTQAKVIRLQNLIRLVECPTLNKEVVISIAQGSVTHKEQLEEILRYFALFLFGVSAVNFWGVMKQLRGCPDTSPRHE